MEPYRPFGNIYVASQVVLVIKNPLDNVGEARNAGSIPGWGRSAGGRHRNPLQYSSLENRLLGHSSWGCKDSDMTKARACIHIHLITTLSSKSVYLIMCSILCLYLEISNIQA